MCEVIQLAAHRPLTPEQAGVLATYLRGQLPPIVKRRTDWPKLCVWFEDGDFVNLPLIEVPEDVPAFFKDRYARPIKRVLLRVLKHPDGDEYESIWEADHES